jgi:ion channel POLLUX/CASTOR
MSKRKILSARLRYEFDKSMSAGPISLIGWLAALSLLAVIAAGAIIALLRIGPPGWDFGWTFLMLALIIAAIFIVSALIGVLSSVIAKAFGRLREGRSPVPEQDHTIILNWSPSVFDIVAELAAANKGRGKSAIVVMADMDKAEMEDAIAARIPDLGNTRLICRRGDPTDLHDLGLVSPQAARSIIVLSPGGAEGKGDDPDSRVVKTVLALVRDPRRRPERHRIAAEIRHAGNTEIARLAGGDEVQLVRADDLTARITVHCLRQSGLSAVYSALLGVDDCQFHVLEQPDLVGNLFGDALMAYENSTLIGLCGADGAVSLNPPMDTVIAPATKAIIIAGNDAAIAISTLNISVDAAAIRALAPRPEIPERILVLGWNRRAPAIAYELSRDVAPGSVLTIAANAPELDQAVAGLRIASSNLSVQYGRIDTTSPQALQGLDVPGYDHVLVLGYSDGLAAQSTDTGTMVTLLHLRQIADAAGIHINVVGEMVDAGNGELAGITRPGDLVVPSRLAGLMLAQASENDNIAAILDDLTDENGSQIHMRPAFDYVDLAAPLNFYTITEAARERGEIALGYLRPRPGAKADGIVVNPLKSEFLDYLPTDRLIILARG